MEMLMTAEIKWLWPAIRSVTVQNGLEIRSILNDIVMKSADLRAVRVQKIASSGSEGNFF